MVKVRTKNKASEAIIQRAILQLLGSHPSVAWAHRMNTGGAKIGNHFVKFAFKGCADIIGQLKDGRLLAIEVKKQGGKASPEQIAFIERVNYNNGVGLIAYSADEVVECLGNIAV